MYSTHHKFLPHSTITGVMIDLIKHKIKNMLNSCFSGAEPTLHGASINRRCECSLGDIIKLK